MKNINIYTIGETVYDIIFENEEIVSGKAGGSMLNASVSLSRAGCKVGFITELGNDKLGNTILNFLSTNHINTTFINRFDNGKTPVALAFLDKQKNATYSFYKQYPQERMPQPFPEIQKDDIVLFGSFFGVNPEVRDQVKRFVEHAKAAGAIIIYDPNIRHPKDHGMEMIIPMVFENFAFADLVRASHEDFKNLFDIDTPKEAHNLIHQHADAALIYTHSSDFVFVGADNYAKKFPVPKIEVVSTIGAGDNFNAGVIYALLENRIRRNDLTTLSQSTWEKIIGSGIKFSGAVCQSRENYIPEGF